MDVKCPHCGTEYEVEQDEVGRTVACQICGKRFVAGNKSRMSVAGVKYRVSVDMKGIADRESREEYKPKVRAVIGIVCGGVMVMLLLIVLPKLPDLLGHRTRGSGSANKIWSLSRGNAIQKIGCLSIEKLDGCKFEKKEIMGMNCFFASLQVIDGFAPNVNILFQTFNTWQFPCLDIYVYKSVKDYEAMDCTVRLLEKEKDWVLMGASGNGLSYVVKIIKDESRSRYVVVTGTMRSEMLVEGAKKTDKEAESVVHKITQCVRSARL